MQIFSSFEAVILLSALVGALHVLGPDHWVPVSVLAWQKGWKTSRTVLFSIVAFFSHVLTGYLLFILFQKFGNHVLGSARMLIPVLGLMFSVGLIRSLYFSKIKRVFRIGHQQGLWGSFAALLFLGPSEMMIPILFKAGNVGMGYLIPFGSFLAGTWLAGILLVLFGQSYWDRPHGLVYAVGWIQRGRSALPLLAGFALSAVVFLI